MNNACNTRRHSLNQTFIQHRGKPLTSNEHGLRISLGCVSLPFRCSHTCTHLKYESCRKRALAGTSLYMHGRFKALLCRNCLAQVPGGPIKLYLYLWYLIYLPIARVRWQLEISVPTCVAVLSSSLFFPVLWLGLFLRETSSKQIRLGQILMTVKILKKYRIVPVFTLGEDWGISGWCVDGSGWLMGSFNHT